MNNTNHPFPSFKKGGDAVQAPYADICPLTSSNFP